MSKKKDISFKEYFRIASWALKVTYGISPSNFIISLATEVFRNIRPIINTYIFAKLLDLLITLVSTENPDIKQIIPFLVLFLIVKIIFSLIDELRTYSSMILRRLSGPYLRQLTFEKVQELGTQSLEMPEVANSRQKLDTMLYYILDVGGNILRIIGAFVQAVITSTIIIANIPIVIPMILAVSFVFFLQRKYYFRKEFYWQTGDRNITLQRKSNWTGATLSEPKMLGEISITGAFEYLRNKFSNFQDYFVGGWLKIQKETTLTAMGLVLLDNVILMIGYLQVFGQLLLKKISVGDTTFYMGSIDNFYSSIQNLSAEFVSFRDYVLKGREVYSFFNLESYLKDGSIKLPRLEEAPLIEIKNISFHYPNDKKNIFENFSLTIQPGEKLAIVGENGAGKTTLIKLISRIYDPQEGEILVNGINLKDIKIDDWYKNLGVLFQEFNFYGQLTVEENIYLGKSIKKLDKEKVIEAAKNADAHEFIMKYKKGYQTVMSERFEGGIRPSNGQRQKIAIARFFYRNAPVAIFDEPSSAIDAEAEYRIFNRIYDFFKEKSVIIISHRFSTVRNADRIIVLSEGKIVEEGTHAELMAMLGKYHSAFTKQAEGYITD